MRKPDPEIYKYVYSLKTSSTRCRFFDDVKANVDAAIAVGMKVYMSLINKLSLTTLKIMIFSPSRE